jgi:serine/threonine protein phosphatase 1
MNERYYCFPDIHGEYTLLKQALDFVYKENPNGGKIIFLGDYIDRGKNNRKVLETLIAPPKGWNFVCLKGNHEVMFLDSMYNEHIPFYDPNVLYEFFFDTQTLSDIQKKYAKTVDKQEYIDSIPSEVIDWLKNLKMFHFEDDNIFAHALYDDYKSPEDQNETVCIWQRMSDFEKFQSKNDRYYLTHGHTPRKRGPTQAMNRTNLDCGAVFYGRFVIGEYEKNVKGPVKFHEFIKN